MAIKQETNTNKNSKMLYVAILVLILFVGIITVCTLRFIMDMNNNSNINNQVINESLETQVIKQNKPVIQTITKTEIKVVEKPVPVIVRDNNTQTENESLIYKKFIANLYEKELEKGNGLLGGKWIIPDGKFNICIPFLDEMKNNGFNAKQFHELLTYNPKATPNTIPYFSLVNYLVNHFNKKDIINAGFSEHELLHYEDHYSGIKKQDLIDAGFYNKK